MTHEHAVIVVDDDEDTRVVLCKVLAQRGFDVTSVASGPACLERLAAGPVGVVVTDVEMPEMSGIELCETVRRRYPDVIAIVVSGRMDGAVGRAATDAGAFQFIRKPVTVTQIEDVLRRALAVLARRVARIA